ncbi:sugar ABC transporter substrate-binding protein [Microbacterium aurantiacum]|uniref:sugar ABC transporter substrate-binding protein n=1 Tax=Microbacterium aurantiacum TaxID=162393 RepID=UPI004035F96F
MSLTLPRRSSARAALVLLAASALALTACSSPASDPASTSAATDAELPPGAVELVDAAYAGTSTALPEAAPPVSDGHDVWVISAFQQVSGLAQIASEVQAAADEIGWDSNVCDGQNNANGAWATCIRQAVAAGADALVLAGVDCAPVRQALIEAREAGVAVAGVSSFDCSDPTQGGSEPLFDTGVQYGDQFTDTADFFTRVGQLRAAYIATQTGGEARILHVEFAGVSIGEYISDGFTEEIANCPGCEIVGTVTITPADLPQLRQMFETGLLEAGDVDAISVDLDFMLTLGVQPALVSAGLEDTLVLGGECVIETLDYMRAGGGVNACIGFSNGRASWSAVDQLNRFFSGTEPVKDGIGWQILDASNQDAWPAEGDPYDDSVDYRTGYAELWTQG